MNLPFSWKNHGFLAGSFIITTIIIRECWLKIRTGSLLVLWEDRFWVQKDCSHNWSWRWVWCHLCVR
jgi:hypothetical protein